MRGGWAGWCAAIAVWAAPAWAAEPAPPAKVWGFLELADGSKKFALTGDEAVVGSGEGVQVAIADRTVAARHARLTHKDGVIHLEDLGSKTGTLAAGTALKPGKPFRILQPIEVSVGAVLLRFAFGERPALLPPTQPPAKGKKPPAKAGKK